MRVVVTGGAGFIGSNLCRGLEACSDFDEIVAVDDLSSGAEANLDGVGRVSLRVGDITDKRTAESVVEGAEAVVHLAARPSVPRSLADPAASHWANVEGTLQVLEASRRLRVAHVIVASSSSVYGASAQLPKHEDHKPSPLSPYAATKLATEAYALAWQHSFAIPALAFRFFNVFGPFQGANHAYAAVVPAFVTAALQRRTVTIFGDGGQTRDFTYVGTVVDVIIDALRRRVCFPEPVNLAFGTRTSLLELLAAIEGLVGCRIDREFRPSRAGDVRDSQADGERLSRLFPTVEAVPLLEALDRTMDWFSANR